MAEDLKVLNRQLGEAQLNLPQTSGLGQMAQAYGLLGQVTQNALDEGMMQGEASKGMQDALSGRPSHSGNPFFKKSAAAYTQAYQTAQTNLLATQGSVALQNARAEMTKSGSLNASSLNEYMELSKGIIQGTLEGADPSIQAQLGLKLQQQAMIEGGKVTDAVNTFTKAQRENEFKSITDGLSNQAAEATFSGDEVRLQNIIEEHRQNSEAYRALGVAPETIAKYNEKFTKGTVNDLYVSEYYRAQQTGTADQFLASIASKKPEGLTNEMWEEVKSNLVKVNNEHKSLVSAHENVLAKEASFLIKTGAIKSVSDLEPYKINASGKYPGLLEELLNKQAKDSKLQQDVSKLSEAITNKDYGVIANSSGETRDELFKTSAEVYVAGKREETGNQNYQMSLKEQMVLNDGMGLVVPSQNATMKEIIKSNNAGAILELAGALEEIEGVPGDSKNSPAFDLTDEERLFLREVQMKANVYGTEAITSNEEVIDEIRKVVQARNNDEKMDNERAYRGQFSGAKGLKELKDIFEEKFGVKADDNPKFFESFKRDSKNLSRLGASPQTIHGHVASKMRAAVGPSKYTTQGNLMHSPPEDMENWNVGYWGSNQLIMKQYQLLTKNFEDAKQDAINLPALQKEYVSLSKELNKAMKDYSSDPEKANTLENKLKLVSQRINRGNYYKSLGAHEIPRSDAILPEEFSQAALVNRPVEYTVKGDPKTKYISKPIYGKRSPLLKYELGGRAREVMLGSDARSSQTGNGDRLYYFSWTDDSGETHVIPNLSLGGDSNGYFRMKSMSNFVPDYQKTISLGDYTKAAEAVFERDNPSKLTYPGLFGIVGGPSVSEISKEQERRAKKQSFAAKNTKKIKEKIKGE